MSVVKGNKILLFAPRFFGYEHEIAQKMRNMGALVDYFDERPKNSFVTKAAIRINPKLLKKQIAAYYQKILAKTANTKYDVVFVINIEAMLPAVLGQLKMQQPNARFILYMWDSLQNKRYAASLLSYFDKVLSFDRSDTAMLPQVKFRPLFFIDQYDTSSFAGATPKTDLCFIGTVHSDRYSLIASIKQQLANFGLKSYFFMYFPSKTLFYYKKLRDIKFSLARASEFSFRSIPQANIVKRIMEARAVLDIHHPAQVGLTMRTIEMLGAGKKLITTNANIRTYDFYHPDNILVIDRKNPILNEAFFHSHYSPIDPEITRRYSLEGWITEIFGN